MVAELRWSVSVVLAAVVTSACSPESSDVVRRAAVEGSARDTIAAGGPTIGDGTDSRDIVLFVGTSLTAGLGLVDPDQAYPARIQARIDSAGLPFRVVNAGVSGDTSAGGLRRLSWLLEEPAAVLVLELGANDGLRGLPVEDLRANLQSAIDLARERDPNLAIVMAGMEAPTNMGERYTSAFEAVYPELAARNDVALVPFLLDGVGGRPDMNQDDGIHPTARGHERMAATVWSVLGPLLAARAPAGGRP